MRTIGDKPVEKSFFKKGRMGMCPDAREFFPTLYRRGEKSIPLKILYRRACAVESRCLYKKYRIRKSELYGFFTWFLRMKARKTLPGTWFNLVNPKLSTSMWNAQIYSYNPDRAEQRRLKRFCKKFLSLPATTYKLGRLR